MTDWIKKIIGAEKRPTKAAYQDKEVTVYSITEDYAVISFQTDGTAMFSVSINELKNLR